MWYWNRWSVTLLVWSLICWMMSFSSVSWSDLRAVWDVDQRRTETGALGNSASPLYDPKSLLPFRGFTPAQRCARRTTAGPVSDLGLHWGFKAYKGCEQIQIKLWDCVWVRQVSDPRVARGGKDEASLLRDSSLLRLQERLRVTNRKSCEI